MFNNNTTYNWKSASQTVFAFFDLFVHIKSNILTTDCNRGNASGVNAAGTYRMSSGAHRKLKGLHLYRRVTSNTATAAVSNCIKSSHNKINLTTRTKTVINFLFIFNDSSYVVRTPPIGACERASRATDIQHAHAHHTRRDREGTRKNYERWLLSIETTRHGPSLRGPVGGVIGYWPH